MQRILWLILIFGVLASCKSKQQTSKTDEDAPLTFPEFRKLFAEGALPYRLASDAMATKLADSTALKTKVVKQFQIDSLLKDDVGEKVKYFPVAYFKEAPIDYFIVQTQGKATKAFLLLFDKKGNYINKMMVGQVATGKPTIDFSLDKKLNLKVNTSELMPGAKTPATKEEYFDVSQTGAFTLVLTNSSAPTGPGQYYNPIDTLSHKHKLSGNYTSGENSIISIRDGESPKDFLFFIHISKDKGACVAEIDGTGRFTSATTGQFRDKNSACVIEFTFTNNKVAISESSCGAYRGIQCSFEGTYTKKKEVKKATKK
ncbi:hypothetical protein LX64_04537 [Chitinophaga skermanii]|uniref:Lipoprotein n=1 Tax=Chitinophaga skermanii TaxID=331697 RepID=A0A327Q695_9BACT|nr:hypothetical protein [Chitinophaga skermanii]RAI99403.1 hypothetical protein LX64_04537 [Chitinophaga skermanii]